MKASIRMARRIRTNPSLATAGCGRPASFRSRGTAKYIRLPVGKWLKAHRVAWEVMIGPIPPHDSFHGTCVCHSCDRTICVNPGHLFLGTQLDNIRDRTLKGRTARISRHGGACHASKLSDTDALEIRRRCLSANDVTSLAKRFNVSTATIYNVVAGRTFRNLPL